MYEELPMMGKTWARNFFKRHPHLSKGSARNISIQRAMSGSKDRIDGFFETLGDLYEKTGVQASGVWNLDECGKQTVPSSGRKVVGPKGKMKRQIVGGDKGETSTIVTFVNASGDHFNPLIIHKGLNVQEAWLENAPADCFVRCSESGYINKEIFLEYVDNFIDWLEEEDKLREKHILLIDGHRSHTLNYPAMKELERAGIEVVLLPPPTAVIWSNPWILSPSAP